MLFFTGHKNPYAINFLFKINNHSTRYVWYGDQVAHILYKKHSWPFQYQNVKYTLRKNAWIRSRILPYWDRLLPYIGKRRPYTGKYGIVFRRFSGSDSLHENTFTLCPKMTRDWKTTWKMTRDLRWGNKFLVLKFFLKVSYRKNIYSLNKLRKICFFLPHSAEVYCEMNPWN